MSLTLYNFLLFSANKYDATHTTPILDTITNVLSRSQHTTQEAGTRSAAYSITVTGSPKTESCK